MACFPRPRLYLCSWPRSTLQLAVWPTQDGQNAGDPKSVKRATFWAFSCAHPWRRPSNSSLFWLLGMQLPAPLAAPSEQQFGLVDRNAAARSLNGALGQQIVLMECSCAHPRRRPLRQQVVFYMFSVRRQLHIVSRRSEL